MTIKGSLASFLALSSIISSYDVAKANETDWHLKEVIAEDDWIPENAEGIQLDCHHFASEFASIIDVHNKPILHEMHLEFKSAEEFKAAFDFQV